MESLLPSQIKSTNSSNLFIVLSGLAKSGMRNLLICYFNIITNKPHFITFSLPNTQLLDFTLLLVYFDDVILSGNSLSEFTFIKNILHDSFKINDLGQLK